MTTEAPGRPVVLAGENPIIRLFRPGSDDVLALASYWRSTYSEQGEGSALLIWTHPTDSGLAGLAPHAIFADNASMARMVAVNFNQYFARFRGLGFESLDPKPARFSQLGDGRQFQRIACVSEDVTIELTWSGVLDAYQHHGHSVFGGNECDVSTVVCPCARASIAVNGATVAGELKRESERESSAFLAFAEVWVAG